MAGPADRSPTTIHEVILQGPPDQLVLAFEPGGSFTRAELADRARAVAWRLREAGVQPGDTVAVMLPNCIEFVDVILATSMLGAVVVPQHVAAKGEMLDRALRLADPAVFVGAATLRGSWEPSLADHNAPLLIVDDDVETSTWSRVADVHEGGPRVPPNELPAVGEADPVIVYASSGTTGPAKGVTLCHAALVEMTRTSQTVMNYQPEDVAYTPMPLFHANAFVFTFLSAIRAGARTVIADRFHVTGFWERLSLLGVTKTSLLGSAPSLLLMQPESPYDTEHQVRLIAAVPRPPEVEAFEARFGVPVTEFYGSTEANLPIAIPYGERQLRTCGRILPGWEYMIADADGHPVPAGEPGELCIRPTKPNVVSSGYWGEPERTVELWRDLWIHTGDFMRVDADGWFYFIDRLKDAIRVSGENVASADVEAAVAACAGVAEVAAFGVPSELGEQDIMVAIVPTVEAPTAEELVEHCRERLPYYAVPRYVEFVDELPRTPTAKVRKGALRERGVTRDTVDLGRPRRPASIR